MTSIVECKEQQKNYGTESDLGVSKKINESLESLLKRFKRKVKDSRVLELYNDNRYYEKPSSKKRKKLIQSKLDQKKKSNEDKRFLDFK